MDKIIGGEPPEISELRQVANATKKADKRVKKEKLKVKKMAERKPGEVVPEGWSVTATTSALYIRFRVLIPAMSKEVRVRIRIPKATPTDTSTWDVEENHIDFGEL